METGQEVLLLERVAQADEAAMHEFYKLFYSSVFSFVVSRLRNEYDASECTNEVMMEVWKSAHRFEGRSRVSTWVLGIAKYKAIDILRARKRHQAHESDDEEIESLVDTEPAIQDVLEAAADRKLIHHCIEKLSEYHMQIINLVFYQELSYPEIASMLECPEGTVKTRVMHAKRKLMNCLAKHFD